MWNKFQFLLPLLIIIVSCQEDEILPYSIEGAYNCFQENTWTVATVDAALVGSWERVYYSCYSGEMGEVAQGELLLLFKADHQLEIYEDGLLERTDTWKVVERGNENFELETGLIQPWLNGDIVLCDGLLVFFNSYIDGCDNFFEEVR